MIDIIPVPCCKAMLWGIKAWRARIGYADPGLLSLGDAVILSDSFKQGRIDPKVFLATENPLNFDHPDARLIRVRTSLCNTVNKSGKSRCKPEYLVHGFNAVRVSVTMFCC